TEQTSLQGQNERRGAGWDILAQDAFTISRALAGKGAGRGGAMHRRTIAVLDLVNGKITDRASDTLTLDVPADFDRSAGVATVDARSRHYLSTGGSTLLNPAHPRPLSWRGRGEECLGGGAQNNADTGAFRP